MLLHQVPHELLVRLDLRGRQSGPRGGDARFVERVHEADSEGGLGADHGRVRFLAGGPVHDPRDVLHVV